MPRLMQSYRKAKRGEVRCAECVFYHAPRQPFMPIGRCGISISRSRAVGKANTCDAAARNDVDAAVIEPEPAAAGD